MSSRVGDDAVMGDLVLPTASLFSKWGFNDGDEPDGFLDWAEEHGHSATVRAVAWHDVLALVVTERLAPALDAQLELTVIKTIHNPVRATRCNGESVEHCWYGEMPAPEVRPDSVTVSYEEILEYVRRVGGPVA